MPEDAFRDNCKYSSAAHARLTVQGFFGCKHFSKANAFLKKEGLLPVDWQIDPVQS